MLAIPHALVKLEQMRYTAERGCGEPLFHVRKPAKNARAGRISMIINWKNLTAVDSLQRAHFYR